MIVSHRHRFVFIAVPRTASQSVRAALRPHLDDGDWEQGAWDVQRRLPVPQLAAMGHGHLGVREAENHLPRKVWRYYFKFALVRDPWDRFLSAAWSTRGRSRAELCGFLRDPVPDRPFPHKNRRRQLRVFTKISTWIRRTSSSDPLSGADD